MNTQYVFALVLLILVCYDVVAVHGTPNENYCSEKRCERWSELKQTCESSCEGPCEKCHHGTCKSRCKKHKCMTCDLYTNECKSTCTECEQCDGDGQCEEKCDSKICQVCHRGECTSACHEPCTMCDGYGACGPLCSTENCEECNGYGECSSVCPPCSRCDGYGACVPLCADHEHCDHKTDACVPNHDDCTGPCEVRTEYGCHFDESLMDKCGKCPSDHDYDKCNCMTDPVAFKGGLSVGHYKDIEWHLSKQWCNITALQRILYSLEQYDVKCHSHDDCADCDPCTTDTCVYGECKHEAVYHNKKKRCGACKEFQPDAYGNHCNDHDPCTFDRCVYGQCTHMKIHECKQDEKPHHRQSSDAHNIVNEETTASSESTAPLV